MPTFCKRERLFEKRLLSILFGKGKRFTCGKSGNFLKVCFLTVPKTEFRQEEDPLETSCKVLVNAPKSRYRHAVTRNRIKRLLREAYRFHKPLFEALPVGENILLLSFQFVGEDISLEIMQELLTEAAQMLEKRLRHA